MVGAAVRVFPTFSVSKNGLAIVDIKVLVDL